ncbi:MAG: hypothetical protein GXO86_01830 [Chlorobi bacterium]|nr:hypothetical protein [Chlorobiota bacterium]
MDNEIIKILKREHDAGTPVIKEEQLDNLPSPVSGWLKSSGIVGKERINSVRLRQELEMKMKPGQKQWYSAVAEQYFSVNHPAFVWRVKMNIPPFIPITGRDRFAGGKGEMQIKAFGVLNVVNEKGEKMDESTMQRFLAEIVWFPSAALSPHIQWEEIDPLSAKATMTYKGTTATGTFYFNRQGDFVRFSAMRYKENKPGSKRLEWIITVKEHSVINGIKIPVKLEVSWMLDSGPWTWLKLEVREVKYNVAG